MTVQATWREWVATVVRPIIASFRQNIGLALFSLALASLLWLFVGEEETIKRGIIPNLEVPAEPVNLPEGLALATQLPRVQVRAQASADVWDSLAPDDFRAFVVLSGLGEGKHLLPVELEARTSRGGLRVLGPVPERIEVELTPMFTKKVPVEVKIVGEPATGLAPSSPKVNPPEITVAGPESLIKLVAKAVARIDISGARTEVSRAVPLEPQNRLGTLVRGVSLEPSTVSVTIPIYQASGAKVVPVVPRVRGSPSPGFNVLSVTVDPATVTISGPNDVILRLTRVDTVPLDITGAREDVSVTLDLEIPPDVEVQGNAQVSVRAIIRPALAQATLGVPIAPQGLRSGLTLQGLPPLVQVTLSGPLQILEGVTPRDVQAKIELASLGPGTHTLPVLVSLPPGTMLVSVVPSEVVVTVSGP